MYVFANSLRLPSYHAIAVANEKKNTIEHSESYVDDNKSGSSCRWYVLAFEIVHGSK